MIPPRKLVPIALTGAGLWMVALGFLGLGLVVTLVGGVWLWEDADG
jgi:hypothetical protein